MRRSPLVLRVARAFERLVWGGDRRGRLFERLLQGHYRSRFRRDWVLAAPDDVPHFFDHRMHAVELAAGDVDVTPWTRAFLVGEVLREGDSLLDIGCGDGFFDLHFFAERCMSIDAVDVEESAITHAWRHNTAPNIAYHVLDATAEPFPRSSYDVIVFDGAIGHFPPGTTERVLKKVFDALAADGVFCGSESLGREGTDHLQFFETLDDLGAVLASRFPYVTLREVAYRTPAGLARREAFWRCAQDSRRLDEAGWRHFADAAPR